jgi:hypothetical protein
MICRLFGHKWSIIELEYDNEFYWQRECLRCGLKELSINGIWIIRKRKYWVLNEKI